LLKQKSKDKVKEIFDDLNWHEEHLKTNLDFKITPLTQAAYLGRKKIIEFILENYNNLDLNLATKQNSYTALSAACMAGNYDIVCLLTEYGADVNKLDSTE
jgi:ankyrin repeat protein